MLIIGIIALVAAIALAVFLVGSRAPSRPQAAAVTALTGARNPFPVPQSGVDPSDPLPSLLKRFEGLATRLTPAGYGRKLQHKLDLAGNPRNWGADRVLAFKGIGLSIGVLLGLLLGVPRGLGVVAFPIVGALAGFFLPDVWIRNLGERRQQQLVLELPDAIDMMTVCVEAGLGFDAALSRVALNLEGPVSLEFARVLQEMQFGKSRTEALRALVDRTDVAELRTFVSSLIQSTELGISIGDVLREQAREMRVRRRQRAEEKAQKLAVKLLFPLLICILPAMFIVVLGPAAMSIIHTLGHVNR